MASLRRVDGKPKWRMTQVSQRVNNAVIGVSGRNCFRAGRVLRALAAVLLGVPIVLTSAATVLAATDGVVSLDKDIVLPIGISQPSIANSLPPAAGDTFTYRFTVGCTTNGVTSTCDNVVITDVIPGELEVIGVYPPSFSFAPALPNPTGATTMSLALGTVNSGTNSAFDVSVRFRNNTALVTNDTVTVDNTATIDATINGEAATDTSETVSVTGVVRPIGGATVSKSLDPTTVSEFSDATVAVTLAGTNTGTVTGTSFTLTDEESTFFNSLDILAVPAPSLPAGATAALVEVKTGATWAALTVPFAGPAHYDGIRVSYTGIGSGATASFPFSVQLRDANFFPVQEVVPGNSIVFVNDAASAVTYSDSAINSGATTSANLTVTGVGVNQPVLQKTFNPNTVIVGAVTPITVSLKSVNSGQGGLGSIDIVDPTPGGDNPFIGTLDVTDVSVVWPTADADQQATLTMDCGTPTTISYPTTVFVLPGACTPTAITSVEVSFVRTTSSYTSAASPEVKIGTLLEAGVGVGSSSNDARTTVTSYLGGVVQTDDATAIVTVSNPTFSVLTNKTFARQSTSSPFNAVALRTTVSPNVGESPVNKLVIQDGDPLPTTDGGLDFWDSYNITSIRAVDCPLGYNLLVEIWDGIAWVGLDQAGQANACLWTLPNGLTPAQQDAAQSVRFTYTNPAGVIPRNTTFQPELATSFRATNRETGVAQPLPVSPELPRVSAGNCSRADTYLAGATPVASDVLIGTECPTITQNPKPTGGGFGVSKSLTGSGPDQSANGREGSQRLADVTIGYGASPGLLVDRIEVQDPIDPENAAPVVGSFEYYSHIFAAVFDIVKVGPYVVPAHEHGAIEFHDGTTWTVVASGNGGASLSATGNSSARAWRLVLTEDPANPGIDPGFIEQESLSGTVKAQYRLRDTFRTGVGPHSAGDPVLNNICYGVSGAHMTEDSTSGVPTGTCDLAISPFSDAGFNDVGNPTDGGWLHNNAQGTAFLANAVVFSGIDQDTNSESEFRILNGVLNGDILKSFTPNASVPLPNLGDLPGVGQQRTLNLVGRNLNPVTQTGQGINVDTLEIADNTPAFWNNFEFVSATNALGQATAVEYDISFGVGGPANLTAKTLADLNNLSTADKGYINGITARFSNVPPYALTPATEVSVAYLVRLRAGSTNVATYTNTAGLTLTDITQSAPLTDTASADITVRDRKVGVQANKNIVLVGNNALDLHPLLNVTVGATNVNELELDLMVIEDNDVITAVDYAAPSVPTVLPTNSADFWPNVDFSTVTSLTAPANAERAFVDYWTGAAWVNVGGIFTVGGTFTVANVNAVLVPADVHGLRIRFESTIAPDMKPAAAGSVTFQVRVKNTATPNLPLTNCSEAGLGLGLYAEFQNPACASFTPILGTQRVDVGKVSTNPIVTPGTSERFTLTITNNGQQALGLRDTAPFTIVDTLPSQLLYNFATADVQATFPAVGGTSNLSGTLPALVQAGSTLSWVFPAGQYLGAGETIVIKITLDVAPAIPTGTQIINTVGVPMPSNVGCTTPDTYVAGECRSTATVTTASGGAIRATKTIDGGGDNVLAQSGAPCPQATGATKSPCVAVVESNGSYTWKLSLQNSGNTNLTNVVLIDRLPVVGDTGAFAPFARGTEWRGIPTSAPVVSTPGLAAPSLQYLPSGTSGAQVTTCIAELNTGTVCGQWVTLPAATPIDAGAIAVRLAVPYGLTGNPNFLPGDTIGVSWDEKAPTELTSAVDAYNPTGAATPDGKLIEWNSFGFRAIGGVSVLRNESNKAGAIFDTATIKVTKLVDENTLLTPADFGPFTIELSCLTPTGTTVIDTFSLSHNTSDSILGLPVGTVCTITEVNAPADISWVPDEDLTTPASAEITVTPATPFGSVNVVLTNTYNEAQLLVDKVVRGATTDVDYSFTVACTLNGQPITLNAGDEAFQLAASDQPRVIDGLPVGANCTVTETNNGNADSSSSVVAGGVVGSGTTSPTGTTIVVNGISTAVSTVTITNSYHATLQVTKTLVNTSQLPDDAYGPFAIDIVCTIANGTQETKGVSLIKGGSYMWDGGELLAGTTCSVKEADSDGANSISIDGLTAQQGVAVVIGPLAQGGRQVAVVNTFVRPVDPPVTTTTAPPVTTTTAPPFTQPPSVTQPLPALEPLPVVQPLPDGAGSAPLPATGSDTLSLLPLALGLVILGIAALFTRRRRVA